MSAIELKITPQRSALLAGHNNELHVLVRAQAPDAPKTDYQRQPLNLAVVIDKSGSMSGKPLAEAKRCAHFMVDSLGPQDRLSIVAYDDQVEVVVPSSTVTNKAPLHQRIDSIHCGGMTALFDGWKMAVEQLSAHTDGHLARVLLLSDGQANQGLTDTDEIARRCADMAAQGITTSTYGLSEHFNEELMMAMAKAGQGQSYYGESADDLMEPFQEEFQLLGALYSRAHQLSIEVTEGVQWSVLNQYRCDQAGRYALPDLAYGGEVWALLKLQVPATVLPGQDESLFVVTASLVGQDMDGNSWSVGPESLSLPVLNATAFGAVAEDDLVLARVQEMRAADIQEQASQAARHHDWDTVDRLLAQALEEAADNQWLQVTVTVLQRYASQRDAQRFAKEASYKSSRMRSRIADKMESASMDYSVAEELNRPMFLRRKAEQGKRMGDDGKDGRS
jgi:Ca-activated chloride channel family protein